MDCHGLLRITKVAQSTMIATAFLRMATDSLRLLRITMYIKDYNGIPLFTMNANCYGLRRIATDFI